MLNKVLHLLPLFVLLPLPLIAQTYSRIEAYGGFQGLWEPDQSHGGVRAETAVNLTPKFGLVGEFGYGSNTKATEGYTFVDKRYTYLMGPRLNFPVNKVRIISQILFGANHQIYRQYGLGPFPQNQNAIDQTTAATFFSFSAGAGIETEINDRFSVRIAQIDLLETRIKEFMGSSLIQGVWVPHYRHLWEDKLRFSAGVVFKFGKAGKSK
jgi:hypothetical protein